MFFSKCFDRFLRVCISAVIITSASPTIAASIVVSISGAKTDAGEIGCALFEQQAAESFPMDAAGAGAAQTWQSPTQGTATCRFENLVPGIYAVSASHDLNGNRRTDKNFMGIPKEAWGVSNNIRPGLRAPKFKEAMVQLAQDETLELDITIKKGVKKIKKETGK